jgi:hypothetical protein
VTTWSLQGVSQMKHKDMLHATYSLKIAICYRNKRHFPLRDRCYCPYMLVILMKRPNNRSKKKVGFELMASHLLGMQVLVTFSKERRLRNYP